MYSSQDCISLFLAKLTNQPFLGGVVALAVVAAAIPVAKRYDIGRNSAGAILASEWYPMIHSYSMKQPSGATAHGALGLKMINGELPVGRSKVRGHIHLSGMPALLYDFNFVWILLTPAERFFFMVSFLEKVSFPVSCVNLFPAPLSAAVVISFSRQFPLWGLTPKANTFNRGFGVFEVSAATVGSESLWVCVSLFFLSLVGARFALRSKPISLAPISDKVPCVRGKPLLTDSAAFEGYSLGCGMIGHVVSPPKTCGQAGVTRKVMPGISMWFTPSIVPQIGGLS